MLRALDVGLKNPFASVVCLALLCAGTAGAVEPATGAPATATPPALTVQDAWIRATPGVDVAAAYLTLRNGGTAAIVITGVRSPVAGAAMIHETRIENGQSSMRPLERLRVAPGETVRLTPGGMHVMLHRLAHPLTPGEKVPLLLLLEGGGMVSVTAPVRPLTAE